MSPPVFDLQKAIADKQERDALRKAIAFTRQAAEQFRAPLGTMNGYHALQIRVLDAIEADLDNYTQAMSGMAPALMNMLAGICGYGVASLPVSYGASGPQFWNETGKRALQTFKACMGAAIEDQVDKQPEAPSEPVPKTGPDLSLVPHAAEDKPTEPLSSA